MFGSKAMSTPKKYAPMRLTLLNLVLVLSLTTSKAQSLVTAEIFHGNDAQVTPTVTTDSENNIICATGFYDDLDANPGPGVLNFNSAGSMDVALTKLNPAGDLIWSKHLSGTLFQTPQVIKTDANDNVFIFGYFNGTVDMNPGAGVTNLVSAGSDDVYVGKYDPDGNLLWAVRTGGTGTEQSYGFDVDADGNAVLHGYFQNTVDFDPGAGTANLTAGFAGSNFLLKLNGDGTYQSAISMGSAYGNKMLLDDAGNVYITGLFWETVDFNPGAGVFNLTAAGFSSDTYILKLNSANVFQWAGIISGNSSEQGTALAFNEAEQTLYVGGFFEGTIDINPGVAVQNLASLAYVDAFLVKLNANDGSLIWGNGFGGTGFQNLNSMEVASSGDLWITGNFENTVDFDPGVGVANLTSAGFFDIYKLTLETSGAYIDAVKIGNNNSDYSNCLAIDNEGAIIISGTFEGVVDFDPGDVTFNLNTLFTGWDGFIAKYCTVYTIHNDVSICEGQSYFAGGAEQTEPGDYYDYFTPVEGCDSIIITHLTISNPVVNLGPNTSICAGNSLTLDAGNIGSTYLWNTGATTQTIAVTAAGTYSVTVTTASGCIASDAITISVTAAPNVNLGADITACADETVILNAGNPGANYLWNTGAVTQTINASTTGTYSVVVTNIAGCTDADIINVTINALPVVSLEAAPDFCEGAVVILDAANPGSNYLWNTGATTQTLSVTESGTYAVTVTNAAGCDATDVITLTEHPNPLVDLGDDIIVCADEIITLDAANIGADYLWNNGATTQTITVTESGTFGVVVTNNFGCTDNDLINITIHPLPDYSLPTAIEFCSNTNVLLDAENIGATYLWNTGATTQTITTAIPGTYGVTITNPTGCTIYDEVLLTMLSAPDVDLGVDTGFCAGSSIIIDASTPDVSYDWNTGATTSSIDVDEAGMYEVIVINADGCSDTDAVVIAEYDLPIVDLGDDMTFCSGDSAYLDAFNEGATYLWNTGATTSGIAISESGTYDVAVTSSEGCVVSDAININLFPLPVADLGDDIIDCENETIIIDATTVGCSYVWNTGATSAQIEVTESGWYSVAITNSFGCFIVDSIYVELLPAPEVDLELPFATLCTTGPETTLSGGTPDGGTYYIDGVLASTINPADLTSGDYTIEYLFTDVNGCSATATSIVSITVCQSINTTTITDIELYPNPAITYTTIVNNGPVVLEGLTIYNVQGIIVAEFNISLMPEIPVVINLENLPSGTYFIQTDNQTTLPLIIQK
jgi:hypothetical protein